MSRLVALDMSLTGTGIAKATDGVFEGFGLITGKGDGPARLAYCRDKIMDSVEAHKPDFVIMEDLAYSMNKAYAKENAGLFHMVQVELFAEKIQFMVAGTSVLKKFATGSGGEKKEQVIKEVLKRFKVDCPDNNTADAVALVYLGMALVEEWAPTIGPQREVLEGLWKKNLWLRKMVKPAPLTVGNQAAPVVAETQAVDPPVW